MLHKSQIKGSRLPHTCASAYESGLMKLSLQQIKGQLVAVAQRKRERGSGSASWNYTQNWRPRSLSRVYLLLLWYHARLSLTSKIKRVRARASVDLIQWQRRATSALIESREKPLDILVRCRPARRGYIGWSVEFQRANCLPLALNPELRDMWCELGAAAAIAVSRFHPLSANCNNKAVILKL